MEIKTKRLLLRPYVIDDLTDVYEYASQKKVAQAAGFTAVSDIRGALLFLEVLQNQGALAIYSCLHQKVIGNISFYPSFASSKFELGYALNSDYWQRGYMTEALQALCKTLGDKEVLAYVYSNNEASLRLLQKCNFEAQGSWRKGAQLFKYIG